MTSNYKGRRWLLSAYFAPDPLQNAITWGASSEPHICFFDGEKWYDADDGGWVTGVTHWMPLPEPPEEDE